jgi:hypothetical protein
VFDADTPTVIIGWLPKAEALFITVEGGELTLSFQGLAQYERPVGIVTTCGAPTPEPAQYGRGVQTMAYTYSKRTGLRYKFGNVNDALNPYCDDIDLTLMSLYGARVTRDNCFEHQHYFINSPTCDMYVLKPVRVTD